jgi:hypothetical protein
MQTERQEEDKPILKLTGENGNAFNLLAKARQVAKANNMNWEIIQEEAMSGDYEFLLMTLHKYFDVY